ncbi:hypothetical protein [Geopseudomonas aromaticivorans]
MRVIQAAPIGWEAVRSRLGVTLEPMETPRDLEEMILSQAKGAEVEVVGEWNLLPENDDQVERVAAMADAAKHLGQQPVSMGFWFHPVSLSASVVEQIAGAVAKG